MVRIMAFTLARWPASRDMRRAAAESWRLNDADARLACRCGSPMAQPAIAPPRRARRHALPRRAAGRALLSCAKMFIVGGVYARAEWQCRSARIFDIARGFH